MQNWVYVNEKLVPAGEASLPVVDLSIQRGYGVFDFLKTVAGVPVFLDDHLQRLQRSAALMHLPVEACQDVIRERVYKIISKNELGESGIRLTITGGTSADGYSITAPNIVIAPQAFKLPSRDERKQGLKLITYRHQRQFAAVKTIDYLMAVWLKPKIAEAGADDVLYYSEDGITECPRANFFLLTEGGLLVTPHLGILHGITRKKILAFARSMSIPVEERSLLLHELKSAQAAFICSTTKGILGVASIDGEAFDPSHELLTELQHRLDDAVQAELKNETDKTPVNVE